MWPVAARADGVGHSSLNRSRLARYRVMPTVAPSPKLTRTAKLPVTLASDPERFVELYRAHRDNATLARAMEIRRQELGESETFRAEKGYSRAAVIGYQDLAWRLMHEADGTTLLAPERFRGNKRWNRSESLSAGRAAYKALLEYGLLRDDIRGNAVAVRWLPMSYLDAVAVVREMTEADGLGGLRVLEHPFWTAIGQGGEVHLRLCEAHSYNLLTYEQCGSVVRIDLKPPYGPAV